MQKKTPDYDNVFKTMKTKHKGLFEKATGENYWAAFKVGRGVSGAVERQYLK